MTGKKTEDFVKEFRLPSFVCEKMINLSNKFSLKQLKELIRLCMKTEEKLKSSNVDKKMELEMLLVGTLTIKK